MNEGMRASVSRSMNARAPASPGFKRQVVFRLGVEEWPLLEAAVAEHGSMQAAVLAGLRALNCGPEVAADRPKAGTKTRKPRGSSRKSRRKAAESTRPAADEEMLARDAAQLLGVKPDTVRGYIRTGRLPGRYDGEPTWRGWLTTRGAVESYLSRRS